MDGVKYDNDKPRWGLVPFKQFEQVVDVLTFGSKKYADDNWKKVPDAEERYFDAMLRHITEYRYGDKLDSETKKSHLSHAICCALFIMWFDDQETNKKFEKPEEVKPIPYSPTIMDTLYKNQMDGVSKLIGEQPTRSYGEMKPVSLTTNPSTNHNDEDISKLNDDFMTSREGVLHNLEHQLETGLGFDDCVRIPSSDSNAYCYVGSLTNPFKFILIDNEIKFFADQEVDSNE